MKLFEQPTRILFFTGKGGVGKTSVACANAVMLADSGKRVLLVSTDPASNLDEVLGVALGNRPTPVPTAPGLSAMNVDPEQAATAYRERVVGPYRGRLPEEAIASMEEQFSGSCTLEIAAFDEFSRLLADAHATSEFDHVIFDTAPTGHTLRLLTLPSAWSGFIETNTTGTSCLGPLAGLQAQQQLYRQTVKTLADPLTTMLALVTRPEFSALREAARTSGELAALGMQNQSLIINGVFCATDTSDPIAMAMQRRAEAAMNEIPDVLTDLPRTVIPLAMNGVLGIEALRALIRPQEQEAKSTPTSTAVQLPLPLGELIPELAAPGHGVILTMGKGGVGKTTVAAAVAVALAERGHRVHLSTTDPAAHVTTTIAADEMRNLSVSRIDPIAETQRYSDKVMQTVGADLDDQGKALLAEDLRSPCTEEIAVFRAFAEAVAEGEDQFVVIDTAPTGHTILLLDAALAYHREVARQSITLPKSVELLLARLRNPEFTRVLIVTLPESTPVHEAAALQQDLRRANIEPFAWVINQSLAPLSISDPVLRSRQAMEAKFIHEVATENASRTVLLPWRPNPPVGRAALCELVAHTAHSPSGEPIA